MSDVALRHCRIRRSVEGDYWLLPYEDGGRTLLNGEVMVDARRLVDGDDIVIGSLCLLFKCSFGESRREMLGKLENVRKALVVGAIQSMAPGGRLTLSKNSSRTPTRNVLEAGERAELVALASSAGAHQVPELEEVLVEMERQFR